MNIKHIYIAVCIGVAGPAQAYIDPGTGSMLVQALIAVIAGGMVFANSRWSAIKQLWRDWFGKATDDDDGA